MYRYKIKEGYEDNIFAGDGVQNHGDGTVTSNHELASQLLSPIEEQREQTQMTATPDPVPVASTPEPPVATPEAPPVAPVEPAPQVTPPTEGDVS